MAERFPTTGGDHSAGPPHRRLASIDTYRGLAMLLMVSNGPGLAEVARHFPTSRVWQFLARQSDHVRWQGCSLWDLIMPAFLFIVGVALPFSVASRVRRGLAWSCIFAHAIWRSVLLVLLGILVWSDTARRTDFMFINVLCQIGLGYGFVFLTVGQPPRLQAFIFFAILIGYWYWFYQYPLPGPSFNYDAVGVPKGWNHPQGMAAHWDLNTNPASAFDRWFLNLFPREEPFRFRAGGGTTLNFVPSIATMLLGVMVGELLRRERQVREKLHRLILTGVLLVCAGIALDPGILPGVHSSRWTICPIIKRIWTPSFVLYTGGWVVLFLALIYRVTDVGARHERPNVRREEASTSHVARLTSHPPGWTFPFVVVGMNSLVMYLLAALSAGWVRKTLRIHLGPALFEGTLGPIVEAGCVLIVLWLACWWLYRRRVFVRI